jgi:hypothetical protein
MPDWDRDRGRDKDRGRSRRDGDTDRGRPQTPAMHQRQLRVQEAGVRGVVTGRRSRSHSTDSRQFFVCACQAKKERFMAAAKFVRACR